MDLDDLAPDIRLVMDRPLFSPPMRPAIDAAIELSNASDIPADALFDSFFVDKDALAGQIRRLLQHRSQVTLGEVAAAHPLEHGLAELVAYFSLASEDAAAVIDDAQREIIVWTDRDERRRQASVPKVVFVRSLALAADAGSSL